MKWSQYFIPTLKETPTGTEAVSHQLLLRAGLVNMLTSGVYSYLPLGYRVLQRIERIITEEMDAAGACKLHLPCLTPMELWKKTGRDQTLAEVMIQFKDKKGKAMCLGPTHEEIITDLVRQFVHSYRQLPVTLYQIQTKFRDEIRPRFGVVRACEFIMKDAYSFDKDWQGLKANYKKMYDAYVRIFQRCNLKPVIVEADSGAMGGDVSHEFLVPAEIGEDQVKDASGQDVPAIELGHIFQLGTKYSEALGAMYLDAAGKQNPIIMGCYGIGVSRFLATIIEVHHDDKGVIWPKEVAPFHVELLPVQISDEEAMQVTDGLYTELTGKGWDVLVDDRDETAGRKFNDADLIGIPIRVTMGKRGLKEGKVEISERATGQIDMVAIDQAAAFINDKLTP